MQHAGVAQDDVALIEAVPVSLLLLQDLFGPRAHGIADFPAERHDTDLIHQRCRIGPGKRDSSFSYHRANDQRITVIRLDQPVAAVIQIPKWLAAPLTAAQHCDGEVGPFQVPGPFGFESVNPLVNSLELGDFIFGKLVSDRDDEIRIAVRVEISHCERTLQICADEVVANGLSNAGDQLVENGVELGVGSWLLHRLHMGSPKDIRAFAASRACRAFVKFTCRAPVTCAMSIVARTTTFPVNAIMAKIESGEILLVGGREVRVTNADKAYFSRDVKLSKLDVVQYYLSVASGAVAGIRDRPSMLKRFVDGAESPPFYQKRAPENRPEWLRTVTLSFPSGRTAEEVVVDDAAGLAWIVNLGCIELHPHAVRTNDLDHPDELRIDLDPGPGVEWDDVRRVAMETKKLLEEMGLRGWPKTSGSRGMHVNVRIKQEWTFTEVRRAALALSREIERRAPTLATSKWWKEERHGVFLDYNQNAKDRTTCSAYSIRPLPDARVSAPLRWEEIPDCEPGDFTVLTMPRRLADLGDPNGAMELTPGSLEQLLELADRDEAAGLGDAPWPPHFRKMEGEPARVAPSRAKGAKAKKAGEQMMSKTTSGKTTGKKTAAKPRVKMPLIVVANSPDKESALAGLARWKAKHSNAAAHLAVDDVLVDSMRGQSSTWTRVRVNLRNVPEKIRPSQETPDPDDDPTRAWREARGKRRGS